jgi:hypothetical protein
LTDKRIESIDRYEHKGTEYLILVANDEFIYRFNRAADSDGPFQFEFRQSPDAEREDGNVKLPKCIREMVDNGQYDIALPSRSKASD